jgi:PBSX family phage terminase large subunit
MAIIDLNTSFPAGADGTQAPLPKQLEFLQSAIDENLKTNSKFIAYVGGIGCLPASALIETTNGPKPISKLGLDDKVLTPSGAYVSTLAFPRGYDYLYRVRHAHGEFVAPGCHLVFCADRNYRRVDELVAHSSSLAYFGSPAQTTSAPSQSELPSSALHLFEKAEGFLEHCLTCYRQYGQLPQEAVDNAQSLVPLLIDALGYNPCAEQKDALQALALGSIRHAQLCGLLSNLGLALRKADPLGDVVALASALPSVPSSRANLTRQQAQSMISSRLLPLLSLHTDISDLPYKPSTIESIVIEPEKQWYWDITVPKSECYYSDGLLHHNSGKTLIGCITMLAMAIQRPGDYLIGRQFSPELKTTTYKTFLEICPPELILEHRIAEATVRIRSVGGVANIYFRPLEEPDKFRSMNLNAFLIDEANQVSEEAFMLLQGRLRGKHWRKGLVVSNPNGHDWLYRWFFKKDHLANDWYRRQYKLIKAPSTENKHLPDGYIESLKAAWSEDRIKREIDGSFDAFEGMVYHEFRRDVHVIKPFRIPQDWPRYIGIDHGYRNPSAWVWVAVGPDGELYAYKEYYEREKLIGDVCSDVMKLNAYDKIIDACIDPSTKARRGARGESDYDEYVRCLPREFPLTMARNDKTLGINRVKEYLKINPANNKPLLYIFDTCDNLLEEMTQYRYQEQQSGQEHKKAEKEEPYKVNDHALDALRYVVMLMPEPYKEVIDPLKKFKTHSLEYALNREIQRFKAP